MTTTSSPIIFGKNKILIEDIHALAHGQATARLNNDPAFQKTIQCGADFLQELLKEDGVIYGVTTGYGDSVTEQVPLSNVNELPLHLTRFHGCGLGETFSVEETRAILGARLASLTQGYSGVSWRLLQQLETLLTNDIMPRIPQEGSVGASGDLTPLSYVAAALIGERDVIYKGQTVPTKEAFDELGIDPIQLQPKEGLAIMNGTAVMTALACLAYKRAEYLIELCSRITSLCSIALQGNSAHFDEILFNAKPHPGQNQVAAWIREDLNHHSHPRNSSRLQDRYSIRCAPHIIGALKDSMPWMRQMIENELNSANDNPIIDGEGQHVLHGGHFYGGHIAMVMDTLKTGIANLADLMDRQMALLMDRKFNNGLPNNLSAASSERKAINHGFKAVQIGISAWTAEALKNTMPASVFSRSTECHNQDKVSMGTIAARDCLRVLQLTEQVAAASLMASSQAVQIRMNQDEVDSASLSQGVTATLSEVFAKFKLVDEDRPLEQELRYFVQLIQARHWSTYG
ncbi:HAL/PAL/TAL family ammonia-lyase [Kangiella sediminilitoris]|uniref:tyrosine ammonia-lyase n=1 Tax=Kangiella sediminilitoris TaxID=1144748 RepID=A0A1B3BDS1_9GAMM|nr:aromatic amino acid ammonia-lyase [Kangiella sediminilitoris]AOE50979.1 histidine ammonia-lyase [Kangiella sediminilitoris]